MAFDDYTGQTGQPEEDDADNLSGRRGDNLTEIQVERENDALRQELEKLRKEIEEWKRGFRERGKRRTSKAEAVGGSGVPKLTWTRKGTCLGSFQKKRRPWKLKMLPHT